MNDAELKQQIEQISIKNRLLYFIAGSITVVALFTIALVTYWMIYPTSPLTITEPLKVLNPNHEVENGGVLILDAEFCKNTDVSGEVQISLIGKSVTVLTTVREGLPKGCNHTPTKVQLPVLLNIEDRKVHYKVTYKLNPLRTVVKEFESENFKIVDGVNIQDQLNQSRP